MDDKLILKILTAIPPEGWNLEKMPVEGVTSDMLYDMREHGLLRRPPGEARYYITVAGSEWVRTYHSQNRTEKRERRALKIACATLAVSVFGAFFAAMAAFPDFREFLAGLLASLQ